MSRGNPPELPSLKNPEWFTDLVANFRNDPLAQIKFAQQYLAQVANERRNLNANPIAMAPAGATEAEQYEHYRRIIETRGYKLDPDAPTVLAMRGISSDGLSHAAESTRAYDDTMVVLTRDANGDPHVRVLAGSTHPGQRTASVGGSVGVPDVANEQGGPPDNEADVGIILQGEYNLVPRGDHNGAAAWNVQLGDSGALPGYRDTDQDGEFSAAERAASDTRDDTLTGVMIHQGGATHPQSAGCLNMSSTDYQQFIDAFGGESERGKLIVLDADDAWPT
jgi:hypothetical protein